jgi:hypothetical protein
VGDGITAARACPDQSGRVRSASTSEPTATFTSSDLVTEGEIAVPYIVIEPDADAGTWTLKERVTPDDMDSQLFCNHLVERLRWAIADVVTSDSQTTSAKPLAPDPGAGYAPIEVS